MNKTKNNAKTIQERWASDPTPTIIKKGSNKKQTPKKKKSK